MTCDELNSGLKYAPLIDSCIEICGKGFNLGFLEWDDGNIVNGDGCDQFCRVETDYKWENGTDSTPDSCVSLIGPKCEISSISQKTYRVNIACDEGVRFNTIQDDDVTVTIEGPLSPYEFEFIIDETTGFETGQLDDQFYIQFEFLSSLFGENEELLTISFDDQTILEDISKNYLLTEETSV